MNLQKQRRWGRLGGRNRRDNLTPERRSEIAQIAALTRWSIPGERKRQRDTMRRLWKMARTITATGAVMLIPTGNLL